MEKETIRLISYIIAIIIAVITFLIFAFMGLNIWYYGDTRTMLQLLALFGVTMACEIGSYIYTFHTAFDEDIITYIFKEPEPEVQYEQPQQEEYEYYDEPQQNEYDNGQEEQEYIEPEYIYDDQYIDEDDSKNEYVDESSDQYSDY